MIRTLLGSALAAGAMGLAAAFVAPTVAPGPGGEPMVVARAQSARWQPAHFAAADCPSPFLLARPSSEEGVNAPAVDEAVMDTLRSPTDNGAPVGDGQARRSPDAAQIVIYLAPAEKTHPSAGEFDDPPNAKSTGECGARSEKFMTLGSI